jgi:hypothetical protein
MSRNKSILDIRQNRSEYIAIALVTQWSLWIILGIGVFIRLLEYLANRSLWFDEARIALNITNRSFAGLLQPLDYDQAAPIGFLFIERLAIEILGNSEYALRFWPLIVGILSLFLFYRVSQTVLHAQAVFVVVGLFAILDPLIYYSSEVKQYAGDAAITLCILLVSFQLTTKPMRLLSLGLFGVVGAVSVWLSHPAVFVLGGVGMTLAAAALLRKDWKGVASLTVVYCCWLVSFALTYMISLSAIAGNQQLQDFWGDSYMPLLPQSFADIRWYIDAFFGIFVNPVGFKGYAAGLAAFLFLLGIARLRQVQPERCFMLIAPLGLTLFASGLHLYPFSGRLLLFLTPILLLIVAAGIDYIQDKTGRMDWAMVALAAILFVEPLLFTGYRLVNPREKEEVRPVLAYMYDHREDEDLLYVYYGAEPAFKYYLKDYIFDDADYMIGVQARGKWQSYVNDMNELQGKKRVWFLFAHVNRSSGVDEEKLYLYHLDSMGRRLDSFSAFGAAVYLYDLSVINPASGL